LLATFIPSQIRETSGKPREIPARDFSNSTQCCVPSQVISPYAAAHLATTHLLRIADFACLPVQVSTRRAFWLTLGVLGIMKPEESLQEQIRRYQRMTGEQRVALALELHELACNLAREGIRHQNPQADEAEVERLLRERLRLARG